MEIISTSFKDVYIGSPRVFGDDRGYFMESFNVKHWEHILPNTTFIQDNESFSARGVLRGMHFQKPPHTQAKLVRVIHGNVLDIIVDLRRDQPTYGEHLSVELSADNKKQLYVPRGFAHGFVVLSPTALFAYKCDNYYAKDSEGGLDPLDEQLNLNWEISKDEISLSDKDKILPKWGDHYSFESSSLHI